MSATVAGVTQGFKTVGRINVEFAPGTAPQWRDALSCTLCGAIVIGNADPSIIQFGSDLLLHSKWHQQLEGDVRAAARFDPRDAPGWSDGH